MKKIIYFIIFIGMFISSCDEQQYKRGYAVEAEDDVDEERSFSEALSPDPFDSLAIGNIYMGIDELSFYYERKNFLDENPSLNNILIEDMFGEFYDGRLYKIVITSVGHYNEGIKDIEKNWPSLYIQKYKDTYPIKKDENGDVTLKKGRCTIFVRGIHLHPTDEELDAGVRNGFSFGKIYRSVIEITDEFILSQKERNEEKRQRDNTMKSLDVI